MLQYLPTQQKGSTLYKPHLIFPRPLQNLHISFKKVVSFPLNNIIYVYDKGIKINRLYL